MRPFLSVQEAADVLGVEHKMIRLLIRRGELPAAKIRTIYRIKYEDLLTYFEAQKRALQAQCMPPPGESEPTAQQPSTPAPPEPESAALRPGRREESSTPPPSEPGSAALRTGRREEPCTPPPSHPDSTPLRTEELP